MVIDVRRYRTPENIDFVHEWSLTSLLLLVWMLHGYDHVKYVQLSEKKNRPTWNMEPEKKWHGLFLIFL